MRARLFTIVLALFAAGCAASAGGGGGGGNANMLTAAAITEAATSPGEPFYDTVNRIRPTWLRTDPTVFIDGSNAGTTAALRTVNAGSVEEARFYRAEEAAPRFGGVYDDGVIEVRLRQ